MKLPEIFIALDLETTGLDFDKDRIIEVALARFENGKVTETLDYFVKPNKELRPFIAKLTGIDDSMLADASDFATLAGTLRAFIGDYPIVAHNAQFDHHFLKSEFGKVGIAFEDQPVIDTLGVSRIAFQDVPNHKLETLINALGIERSAAHRALPDAIACGELLVRSVEEMKTWPLAVLQVLSRLAKGSSLECVFDDGDDSASMQYNLPEVSGITVLEKYKTNARAASFFEENGILAKKIPGYVVRESQVDYANVVERNMFKGGLSVLEAGTGVGKSLAYLVPAALKAASGERVLVSTATKTLQEQLYKEELPLIQEAFGDKLKAFVLKGRGNYICLRKFEAILKNPENYLADDERETFMTLIPWIAKTATGDISENTGFNYLRNKIVWNKVVSDASACEGEKCPHYAKCPAIVAKRKAAASNLVFVNHSLFLSDLALDFALLPTYEHVIFDEAHRLPAISTQSFGRSIRFFDLRNIDKELMLAKDESRGLIASAEDILGKENEACAELRVNCQESEKQLHRFLMKLGKKLIKQKNKNDALCYKQSVNAEFDADPSAFNVELSKFISAAERVSRELREKESEGLARSFDGIVSALRRFACDFEFLVKANRENWVFFLEEPYNPHTVKLNARPISAGSYWNEKFYPWIKSAMFTSATLSVKGTLDYYVSKMHMDKGVAANKKPFLKVYPQPISNAGRTIAVASFMPKPNAPEYQQSLEKFLCDTLPNFAENTMVLFTSMSSMLQVQARLAPLFAERSKLLLCQNVDGSLESLMDMFRKERGACLLGCQTLWEGINLPGDALKNLVIPKLPFPNPADPLVAAQSEALKAAGENSFRSLFVPEAYLGLRQGIGRLIRSEQDSGTVLLLDTRILTEMYGKTFMKLWNFRHLVVNSSEEAIDIVSQA